MDCQEQDIGPDLAILIKEACLAGATEVMPVAPAEIVVEERLAGYCREPQCPNFGQSPSCPPHVAGPAGFLALRDSSRAALVVRIEVPSAVLFSDERREVMRLLHEITAGIERSAIARGYTGSKAFAGGSCKDLFCHDHLYLPGPRRQREMPESDPGQTFHVRLRHQCRKNAAGGRLFRGKKHPAGNPGRGVDELACRSGVDRLIRPVAALSVSCAEVR